MFQKWLLKINNSIWLIPGFYCSISLALAVIIILTEKNFHKQMEKLLPKFLLTNADLAQTILGVIAGSLLTMTTITFSTIMVVLTTYSSQFSPRTLRNFITDQTTLRVLGIFMGGFVYSIFSLLFMKSSLEHYVISSSLGVLIALICLAVFAHFIQHVATYIQVTNLIALLTLDVEKAVKSKDEVIYHNSQIFLKNEPSQQPMDFSRYTKILSKQFGYIQLINFEQLLKHAVEHNHYIEVHGTIGQFLAKNSPMLTIYHKEPQLATDYLTYLTIGRERTTLQDEEFAIRKIVEVTLRAISPGINDPDTAIECIQHLGVALTEVSKLDGAWMIFQDNQSQTRMIAPQKPFSELLYLTFYQISHYGRSDISIIMAILEALIMVVDKNERTKQTVLSFTDYILEGVDFEQFKKLDRERMAQKRSKLVSMCEV
jgi:uncharacterized membrane protein